MNRKTRHVELIETALEAFRQTTGLPGKILKRQEKTDLQPDAYRRLDALIEIKTQERKHQFAVDVKLAGRIELLAQLKALWPPNEQLRLLVVVPYITTHLAEKCRQMELLFLDAAGNAYIADDGLFVYVTGRKQTLELRTIEGKRTNNAAGLRLLFAILCRPQLLNATYREIATTARVALGTVGPVIKDLEARKIIARFGTTLPKRRLIEPGRLLQEWVTFYPTTLRPKLQPRRFRANNREGLQQADLTRFGAYWGGEVAADRLTHYLKPAMLTIYVRHNATKLITEFRLRADINGDIEILDAFWDDDLIPNTHDVVPPILAYADLMTTTDGRNLEAAKLIYEQYITPNFPAF